MFEEFKEFAVEGDAFDLAVGVVIGGAFGQIVASLVNDIIMPLVGLLIGGLDFTNLFLSLDGSNYATLKEAQEASAATLNYGLFISSVVDFLIIAGSIFFVIKQISRFKREEIEDVTSKDCPYCISEISIDAVRCPHCTSELDKVEV